LFGGLCKCCFLFPTTSPRSLVIRLPYVGATCPIIRNARKKRFVGWRARARSLPAGARSLLDGPVPLNHLDCFRSGSLFIFASSWRIFRMSRASAIARRHPRGTVIRIQGGCIAELRRTEASSFFTGPLNPDIQARRSLRGLDVATLSPQDASIGHLSLRRVACRIVNAFEMHDVFPRVGCWWGDAPHCEVVLPCESTPVALCSVISPIRHTRLVTTDLSPTSISATSISSAAEHRHCGRRYHNTRKAGEH